MTGSKNYKDIEVEHLYVINVDKLIKIMKDVKLSSYIDMIFFRDTDVEK